jgi:hypothetical protein
MLETRPPAYRTDKAGDVGGELEEYTTKNP